MIESSNKCNINHDGHPKTHTPKGPDSLAFWAWMDTEKCESARTREDELHGNYQNLRFFFRGFILEKQSIVSTLVENHANCRI